MCYNIGMLAYTDICCNIERFERMCAEHGVTLTLATKTIPREVLARLNTEYDLIFGENRVQELCEKYIEDAHWIFIGRLQKNKVKYLVDKVDMICSVDSVDLAQEIEKRCAKIDRVMPVLMELNMGEAQKGGVAPEEAYTLADAIMGLKHLSLEGVMVVLPAEGAEAAAERASEAYRALGERYPMRYLSMGMSGDYDIAMAHGANMLRLGSAVFGKRSGYGNQQNG